MKNVIAIMVFVIYSILFLLRVSASQPIRVTLYCQTPTASCDAAMSHMESRNIPFRLVRAWDSSAATRELETVINQYGVRLTNSAPVIRIEDSIIVGILNFDGVYSFISNNRH